MVRLAPDMEENRAKKDRVPDGQLGFEIPKMAQDVVAQLWVSGRWKTSIPGIDPRYAHKTR